MSQKNSISDKEALLARLLEQKKQAYSYPLSYGQQSLWFIYQNAPDSPAYHMAWLLKIQGNLNILGLPFALKKLVHRHPALRSTVELAAGEPVQTVHPTGTYQLTEHQAENWSEQELQTALRGAYEQPFALSSGPILRVDLFYIGKEQHILLLTMHHLFGDAWSMNILSNELLILCQAEGNGEKVFLPTISASYSEFVRDEAGLMDSPVGEELAQYWKNRLSGSPPVLNLTTDFPRPAIQTYNGAAIPYALTPQLTKQLNSMARQQETTLFTLLLTAFQILLHRYTGQNEIWVGTPASTGRNDTRFSNTIGYLVNPIVLRATIDSANEPSFYELLGQNRQRVLEALEHTAYPFPLLVKTLQPHRDSSYSPLFQAMLDFKPAKFFPSAIPGLQSSLLDMGQMEGQFDLTLTVNDGEQLKGSFNYNRDLFKAQTVERIAEQFEILLTAIVKNPQQPVGQLPIISEKEVKLLQAWNDTTRKYSDEDQTIADLFEEQAQKTPDAIALIFGEKQLTYHWLNKKANQLAYLLLEHKNTENPLIGICLERSQEMVIALLAVLKAGLAYVPIDPEYPQERIRYMIEDSAVSVLLTLSHQKNALPIKELKHACTVLCLDVDGGADQSTENPVVKRQPDDLAYMIYTSGSTGTPKGAMNAHSGIVNRLLWMQETYQLTPIDRVLQKTTFSFDVSIWEFFWPLITGAGLVLAKPEGHKDPVYLTTLIAEQQVTTIHFVPSMLQTFLTHADTAQCSSLKRVICSGEALAPEHVQQFFSCFGKFGTELHNLYGPTEAAIDVSHWPCQSDDILTTIPIGRPVANTRLYVLDRNHRPMPVGVPGELYIGGLQVGLGYLNRPDLTAKAFIKIELFGINERVYKTGDLARWLPNGNLEYLGRIDHQVKLRGFRIELGEIESAVLQLSIIRECVVVMRETDSGSKQLVAYVVKKEQNADDLDLPLKLKEHLKQTLPEYMVPAIFMFLETLPLSANGKIDRKALPAPKIRKSSYVCARDAVELSLIQIWEKLFDISPVSVQDDFFDIGGDSLLAMRMIFHIREELDRTLPLHTLFQNRTLEQLAAVLRQDTPIPAWQPMVCHQAKGKGTPLFFAHASGGSAFNVLEMALFMGKERPFYAIHPRGAELGEAFHESIEAMARDYVTAMRKIQPKGPYLLGGWSFGGTVIFEMTRLLEQMGEKAPLLIMIDPPEPQAIVWKDNDVDFLMDRIPHYHGMSLDEIELDQHCSEEKKVAYLLNAIKMNGMIRPDIDQEQTLNWFNMYKHHNKLVGLYNPPCSVDSKILFFKPAKRIPFDDQMGKPIEKWKPFVRQGMDVIEAPGNHFTMVSPANTVVLAEMIQEYLATTAKEVAEYLIENKENTK